MDPQAAEVIVPVVLFISIAVIFALFLFFKNRNRREMQMTLRAAIDKGQELTPEVIERLGTPPAAANRDMRRGIISLAIGFGFIAFAFAIPEEDVLRPMLGIASFPVALGLGFLLMHKLSSAD